MRVLCTTGKHPLEYLALEVDYAGYEEDFNGLCLVSPDMEMYYIPNLCRAVCNDIIKYLFIDGFYDLTACDSIVHYEEDLTSWVNGFRR